MKLNKIALALLVAAPFAAANAGVTVTPLLLGYHWYDGAKDEMREQNVYVQEKIVTGAALGLELTPWLQFEVEYQRTNTEDDKFTNIEAKHEIISGNFIATTDVFTGNYDGRVKPYILLGAGQSKLDFDDGRETKDTIMNGGLGVLWQLNDALTLRTEGRAVYNYDHDWWEAQAFTGLQVVLGGHLKPAAPVAPVEPIAPPPPVVEPTPIPEPVVQPPQQLTEDLKLELRVFFDINKSNIKDQYKPEVAKVADKLREYPNATAQIEGHTDNTGPRKLNERLSVARANSVKSMLVSQYGIDANRLTTQGYAWDRPIAPNNTKEGRAMNRRVYAVITGSRTVTVPADQVPVTTTPTVTP